jgi:hypothetical protein
MHFKEKPGCKSLDGVFQLDFITQQMKDEGAITEGRLSIVHDTRLN